MNDMTKKSKQNLPERSLLTIPELGKVGDMLMNNDVVSDVTQEEATQMLKDSITSMWYSWPLPVYIDWDKLIVNDKFEPQNLYTALVMLGTPPIHSFEGDEIIVDGDKITYDELGTNATDSP